MESKRKISLDILKTVGILFIILAHSIPNDIITQIRSFDVPLLVIISGILGAMTYKKGTNLIQYFKKRFIRLVIPTWIFLTIFFIGLFILSAIGMNIDFPDRKTIISSYLCIEGIGYVWIIRVYMFCAIALPMILKAKEKIKDNISSLIVLLIYIIYEIIYYFLGKDNSVINYIFYYFITYGIVCTYIGVLLKDMKDKKLLTFSIIFLVIFMGLATYFGITEKSFILTNEYKYPPRLYYLSYAIGITALLYYLIDRKNIFYIQEKLSNKIVEFISKHSMWIYLWHVPFIFFINKVNYNLFWLFKYIFMLTGGMLLTYIQVKIIEKLKISNKTILSIFNG